ncbi:MAG: 4-hydroxyphenylacetate 3-hydroxylase N-terminal domain-containing protein, partial [Smithella sp.]|nr:4-hydroxyphenylacetate 3-hydroxylase N-terminal domain-containing protein [Smithella sp.]
MTLKTANQYEESLRKMNLKVYLPGELVKNPVDHPIIRPSMNSVKMTYALAQDTQHEDIMTAKSHLSGEKINRFCHLHQSTEDLIKKVKMQRLLGQKTASCFQMCVGMDAINKEDADYAVSFVAPADAEGIYYIYGRQSCDTRKLEGCEIDVGNRQFGGHEALMVFDN